VQNLKDGGLFTRKLGVSLKKLHVKGYRAISPSDLKSTAENRSTGERACGCAASADKWARGVSDLR
jgi:hypothetical protein